MPIKAAEYIKSQISTLPEIGVILGSGLGSLAEKLEDPFFINYGDIPGFPRSTAPGHKGRLAFGRLSGKNLVCMQGRFHFYEGYKMSEIALPIRTLKLLGIKTLIVTNAAGGVNTSFEVGDLMLIKDHINMMGTNPLIGPNADDFGERFPDMSKTYTPALRELAHKAAAKLGMSLHEGVYCGCTGPSYETPAEIRAFRVLGADTVGMSTVPEVIVAGHCGLPILAISLVTNMAAGVLDQPLSGDEVIEIGNKKSAELQALVAEIIYEL
ncbi:MAG TPA: purine-nucleoside phosphorylase [Clostridiales bacterium]|jgi:purine-nucleoside phosphorylase|nr:purine-nucleoside phosphorylase [Clostridiales bacterium]